jgi:tetratricopeptide (TPR) repeat protein
LQLTPQKSIQQIRDLRDVKRYNDALEYASSALRRFPDDGDVILAVAALFEETRQYPLALNLLRKVTDALSRNKRPVPAKIMMKLAGLALVCKHYDQALEIFEKLASLNIDDSEVLEGLAEVALHEGDLEKAENLIARLQLQNPKNGNARLLLARLLVLKNEHDRAMVEVFKNIDTGQPHLESIDFWLATMRTLHRDEEAGNALKKLARRYPTILEFAYGAGAIAHRAGEYQVARTFLTQALSISPENNRILFELSVLERLAGNISASMGYAERALSGSAENPPALRTHAAEHKFEYGDEPFRRLMRAAVKLTSFNQDDQINLHYALGKAFEDVGDLDTAFRHFEVGGIKRQKDSPYKRNEVESVRSMLCSYITKENLEKTNDVGSQDETPIFILGMPRSGTSLLEQILASHRDVYGAGELKYISRVLENIVIANNAVHIGEKSPIFSRDDLAPWAQRGDKYVEYLRSLGGPDVKRIVDKMPGNYNYVGMINAILPKARIIHSQRHPLDTCVSSYRILFTEGQLWSYDLSDLAHTYRKYWDLMEFWRSQFPGRLFEVYYEQNVADVEGQARSLIEHIGLDWDDGCLDFHKTDRVVKTASASQVRKPIYTSSTNRWRKYENQIGQLMEELSDIVKIYEDRLAERMERGAFTD